MTQEKQKVIRVLQPTKKPTKSSPKLVGLTVAAIGIITASAVLFTFLPFNTDSQALDQTILPDTENKTLTKGNTTDAASAANQTQDESNTDGDVIHPQPKLNEITNIFRHQKEVAKVEAPTNTGNPFDSMLNTAQQNPLPTPEKQLNIPNANSTKADLIQKKPDTAAKKPPLTVKEKDQQQNPFLDKSKVEKNEPKNELAKSAEVKPAQQIESPVTAQSKTTAKEKE